jgi:rSAM/selenodomain-associated transferase 1
MERSVVESSSPTARHSSPPNRTLVIMAKAPTPGMVKTRLLECLPTPAVTALYRCFLQDSIALAKSLTSVEVAVMCPEPDQEELAHLIGRTVPVVAQKGQGLAAGLRSVFQHFIAAGRKRVIAFNSDSPHLAPSVLESAYRILDAHDVVIGPTHDGGYYLVGAKADHPALFATDGMGTGSALDGLLKRTKALELSIGFSEPFYDIDVANDLILLARELQLAPGKAPRTAKWLGEWQRAVARLCNGMTEL